MPRRLKACERAWMRKTLQLLLAASLCGCVAATPRPDAGGQHVDPVAVSPIPISLALEEIITTGIRQRLKNPISARFGTMLAGERALNGRHEIVVCGSVEDKTPSNDEPFLAKVYPDAGNTFELVALGGETPNVGDACRLAGLPIEPKKS